MVSRSTGTGIALAIQLPSPALPRQRAFLETLADIAIGARRPREPYQGIDARRSDRAPRDRRFENGAGATCRVQCGRLARVRARAETRTVSENAATAIVIGASSGLGRALAVELARNNYALLLVASDLRDLDALGASLNLAHGIAVRALALDLAREVDPGARIVAALDGMPRLRLRCSCRSAIRATTMTLTLDAAGIGQLLAVNLHAPLAIVHALLPVLVQAQGTIVLFGSVAATRGRGRNVVYAAAKRALVSLYESLRQRYRARELRVQIYELGFMKTNLTHGMRLPLPAVIRIRLRAPSCAGLVAAHRVDICQAGGRRSRSW